MGKKSGGCRVTASDASKNFRARRDGVPLVRVEPVDVVRCTFRDLADWYAGRERLDSRYLDEVERMIKAANAPAVPGDP